MDHYLLVILQKKHFATHNLEFCQTDIVYELFSESGKFDIPTCRSIAYSVLFFSSHDIN